MTGAVPQTGPEHLNKLFHLNWGGTVPGAVRRLEWDEEQSQQLETSTALYL